MNVLLILKDFCRLLTGIGGGKMYWRKQIVFIKMFACSRYK